MPIPHFESTMAWVFKYSQNAKTNFRLSGLTILAALLDKCEDGVLDATY